MEFFLSVKGRPADRNGLFFLPFVFADALRNFDRRSFPVQGVPDSQIWLGRPSQWMRRRANSRRASTAAQ
jgi:hypothetical protein